MSGGGVDARLVVERPGFRVDVGLRVACGEVVALLGPNGAGKTTLLRALAGLQPITDGYVRLDDRDLDRPAVGTWVAPQHRRVGMVFQDYLLFPQLSVVENVAFGPRRQGLDRRAARTLARDWLDRVGLAEYADRRPGQLSGGQAQRVALARALAVRPALLLLDEPLAALDARTRLETRSELRRHLSAFPGATLLVTHDPLDALVLADRLVVVEEGRVVQEGDAATVTGCPRTGYVAGLVGLNLHRGVAAAGRVHVGDGVALAAAGAPDGEVFVVFPPAAVSLHVDPPGAGAGNAWPARVAGVERHGDHLRVRLTGRLPVAADVTPAEAARLTVGSEVWAAVRDSDLRAFPVADS